jgi:hypothetical protein
MFVHSKCEDELLAKAELLLFAELASLEYPGRPVVGSYEVQPNLTIAELKRAYRYDHKGYRRLLEWRDRILREGWFHPSWKPED